MSGGKAFAWIVVSVAAIVGVMVARPGDYSSL